MSAPSPTRSSPRRVALLATLALASACGGGTTAGTTSPAGAGASDAEWRALAAPRPDPLAGAARVTLGEVQILGTVPWHIPADLGAPLALQELVAAGLLRRRDVGYVERRRFAEAAQAERLGTPRPGGAPRAGVSPGPELVATAVWSPVLGTGHLDVRLVNAANGTVVATHQSSAPGDADPTSVARTVVSGILAALDDLGRRPGWTDPVAGTAPAAYRSAGVPAAAAEAFFRGLAAEERWNWEGARIGYQAALDQGGPGFVEAAAALARAARLRNGGTLGVG